VMIGDFLTAPEVQMIDLSGYGGRVGDRITIRATDDFEVVRVEVKITDINDVVIEQGAAVKSNVRSDGWLYATSADVASGPEVKVEVAAIDRPGNRGMKELRAQV